MIIKEVIVVEGRDDTAAVKRACEAETIETHGYGIRKETWDLMDMAYRSKGIIIFTDPDRAGLAMVMMGLGIRSSFGYCWTLTQYHLYYKDDWLESDYTSKARARAEKLIRTGLAKIHDRELAAKCCVMLKEFKRAVTEFPETMAADFVRTRCDSYKDYNFGLPNKILCH